MGQSAGKSERDPLTLEMYRYRGETISIGGRVDFVIRRLAIAFAASTQSKTLRSWDDLKRYIGRRGLTNALQPQLQAVAASFHVRELAAHTTTVVYHFGGPDPMILRMYYDRADIEVEQVTIDDLKREASAARAGHDAVLAVGAALHDDNQTVLSSLDMVVRFMLIGKLE